MALIKCPECGHQVSDKASSCPNCGCPIEILNNQPNVDGSQTLNAKPVVEPEWVKDIRYKSKSGCVGVIISWIILIIVLGLTIILAAFNNEPIFIVFAVLLGSALFVDFILGCVAVSSAKVIVEYHNNYVIALRLRMGEPSLYIDGKKEEFVLQNVKKGIAEYKYKFDDGEIMKITIQSKNALFEYSYNGSRSQGKQTIINNFITNQTINKKNSKSERSDMEKILIKNAKIDALASIDPTNTEKSKEQINIVKELDDLD